MRTRRGIGGLVVRVAVASLVWAVAGACVLAQSQRVGITLLAQDSDSYRRIVEAFESANPDVDVDLVTFTGGYANAQEKVTVMAAGGVAPDVFWLHSYSFGDLYDSGLLLALDDLIARDPEFEIEEYFPATVAEFSRDGQLYGLPRETSTMVTYYNQDMFDQSGLAYPSVDWTYDDLVDLARRLTRGEEADRQWGFYQPSGHATMLPVLWAFGGDLVTEDRTAAALNRPESIQALQWIADLRHVQQVAAMGPDLTAYGRGVLTSFNQGKLAMFFEIRTYVANVAQGVKWDVHPVPVGPRGRFTRVAGSAHAIGADTTQPDASWRLLKALSGVEAQRIFGAGGTVIPALRSVATGPDFLDETKPPASDMVFLDALAYARPEPVTTNWPQFISVKGQALAPVFRGEVSAAQAVAGVNDTLTAIIRGE